MVIPGRRLNILLKEFSESENISTEILDIENLSIEVLESKLITADGILIGSPTINQNTLLPVYKLFSHINPIEIKANWGELSVLTDGVANLPG